MDFDVQQVGEGRDLLLLHSLLTDRQSFARVLPALSGKRRVSLLALPGFGGSAPAGPLVEDYADRVAEFVATLPGKPDVIGNGFGGFVALALAARHGGTLEKLVLADSAACFPEEGRAPFRAMAEAVEKNGMAAIVPAAVRRNLSRALSGGAPRGARGAARGPPAHAAPALRHRLPRARPSGPAPLAADHPQSHAGDRGRVGRRHSAGAGDRAGRRHPGSKAGADSGLRPLPAPGAAGSVSRGSGAISWNAIGLRRPHVERRAGEK